VSVEKGFLGYYSVAPGASRIEGMPQYWSLKIILSWFFSVSPGDIKVPTIATERA